MQRSTCPLERWLGYKNTYSASRVLRPIANLEGLLDVRQPAVEALLAAGANPSASIQVERTGDGLIVVTPMSLAVESKDRAIMAMLVGGLQKGQRLVGCAVRVDGYRLAKPALNGKCGKVGSFDPKTGQCTVQLDLKRRTPAEPASWREPVCAWPGADCMARWCLA